MARGVGACDSRGTVHAIAKMSNLVMLVGALMGSGLACGPLPAATTTTDGTTETSSTTTSTGTGTNTSTAPTSTTSTSDTTTSDTTTGGSCLEFETSERPEEEGLPVQFTCGHTTVVCPSNGVAGLFSFEGPPESEETVSTEDLSRVHCLIEALRDRVIGEVSFELSWPVLGSDRVTLEIAGEFVISRREVVEDFNYEYAEAALWLESGKVFALCRGQNTASAAWGCLRPYILADTQQLECVAGPLVCE